MSSFQAMALGIEEIKTLCPRAAGYITKKPLKRSEVLLCFDCNRDIACFKSTCSNRLLINLKQGKVTLF